MFHLPGAVDQERASEGIGTVMIDAAHLKAHGTTASWLKYGLFRAVARAPVAGSTPCPTRFATTTASELQGLYSKSSSPERLTTV